MKPLALKVTSRTRRRAGDTSAASVMQVGAAPPSPRPVTKRNAISISIEVENAQASVPTANTAIDSSSTGLRPRRSASGPNSRLPISSPNRPAPNAGASCAGVRPQAWCSAGAI